jgi:hypothetical protein
MDEFPHLVETVLMIHPHLEADHSGNVLVSQSTGVELCRRGRAEKKDGKETEKDGIKSSLTELKCFVAGKTSRVGELRCFSLLR